LPQLFAPFSNHGEIGASFITSRQPALELAWWSKTFASAAPDKERRTVETAGKYAIPLTAIFCMAIQFIDYDRIAETFRRASLAHSIATPAR